MEGLRYSLCVSLRWYQIPFVSLFFFSFWFLHFEVFTQMPFFTCIPFSQTFTPNNVRNLDGMQIFVSPFQFLQSQLIENITQLPPGAFRGEIFFSHPKRHRVYQVRRRRRMGIRSQHMRMENSDTGTSPGYGKKSQDDGPHNIVGTLPGFYVHCNRDTKWLAITLSWLTF